MSPINDGLPSGLHCTFESGVLKVGWTVASIPDGYSAVLTLTDGKDRPLSPEPEIAIRGAEATVSGAAIQPHATLKVSLRAVSPAVGPQTIELIALEAPAAPQLVFGVFGLDIRWNSIQNALAYDFDLTDEAGHPVTPPPITGFDPPDLCHVRIAFSNLPAQAAWQVRVRATANHSLGPWSAASTIAIDKSRPLSPLLLNLLERLRAAGQNFELGPQIICSGKVTSQFQSLLGVASGILSVQNASLDSTLDSVTLRATLATPGLFHAPDATGEFIFTDKQAIIELKLRYPLDRCSIAQLKTAGLLPADAFGTNWAAGLAELDNLTLELDTAAYRVKVASPDTAAGPAWSILGLQSVTTDDIQPQLEIYAPRNARAKRYVPRVAARLNLGSATPLSVYLQLPAGYTPWEVGLTDPWYAGNLTSIYSLFGGQTLSLPDGLVNLGQVTLTSFRVTHAPNSNTWSWDVGARLGPNDPTAPCWEIIEGVLELGNLSAALHVEVISTSQDFVASTSGAIAARFTLGTLAPMDAVLRVPGFDGTWSLSIATSRSAFALSQTAQMLAGSTNALDNVLARMGTTSGFTLLGLDIDFKPSVPELTWFAVAIAIDSWTVPSLSWFTVEQVKAQLTVVNPRQQNSRVITGSLDARLTLGSVKVGIVVSFDTSEVWKLRIGAEPAHLNGLADLSNLVSADEVTGNIPASLPTSGGFEMAAFGFEYNSEQKYFQQIGFVLRSGLDWEILDGFYTLNDVDLAINVTKAGLSEARVVTGSVAARMTLAGVEFTLSARKPAGNDPWVLSGRLENQLILDFRKLLREQISPDWSLPSGFPVALTIVAARADLTPNTGSFDFSGAAVLDWQFDLGATSFALKSIGATIHRVGTGDATPTNALLYGSFDFGDRISADASIQLGASPIDTVVQVQLLVASDAARLQVPAFADRLSGATGPAQFAQIVPEDLPTALGSITATVNVTRKLFLLKGTITRFDAWAYLFYRGATLADPMGNNTAASEYLFAAGLGQNFIFEELLHALGPVDAIIAVRDARIAVYSVAPNGLSGLKQAVEQMSGLTAPLTWPLPDTTGIVLPPERGLVFSAEVRLDTPNLFRNVLQIGSLRDNPNLRVLAVINRNNTADSVFSIHLPDITILSTITLAHVSATFRPSENNKVTLAGDLVLEQIFQHSFGFHGELTMTSASLAGELSLLPTNPSQNIARPFSLPGIVFEDLKAKVDKTFATAGPPATQGRSRFSLLGQVRLGRPPQQGTVDNRIFFTAHLVLEAGVPELLDIELDRDLDIGGFLAQCFTGDGANWPSTFIDVIFKNRSRVYYCKPPDKPTATGRTDPQTNLDYLNGFNVDAVVVLRFVEEIELQITFHAGLEQGTDDRYTSIRAEVGLLRPVNLLFISLAGKEKVGNAYTGGPRLTIANGAQAEFGFEVGINFLGRAIISASVQVLRNSERDTVVNGTIALPDDQSIEPFGKLAFSFSYTRTHDERNLFRIRNWPEFTWIRQIFDIIEKIREAANAVTDKGCLELAGLVANELLHTSYRITPSADSRKENGHYFLEFSLTVSCEMSIGNTTSPFLTSALPPITFSISTGTTFDELPGEMANSIAGAGLAFVRDLLSRSDKIAIFLAMTFAETGVQLALELVCRGLVDVAVPAAVEAGIAAIVSQGGPIAVGAAGAAGFAIVTGSIANAISETRENPPDPPDPSHPDGIGKPALRDARYVLNSDNASGKITGKWSTADRASGYELELLSGSRVIRSASAVLALAGELPLLPGDVAAGSYQVRVVAVRGDQRRSSDTKTIIKLVSPTVRLSYADGVLRAAVSGEGDSFSITFYGRDRQALGSPQNVPAGNPHAALTLPLPHGASYEAAARAFRSELIPSDPGARTSLVLLGKPQDLAVHQQGARLSICWQAVPEAVAYSVRLLGNNDVQGVPQTDITTTGTTLDLPATTPGKIFHVEVRATSPEQSGDWSDPVAVALLATPSQPELLYDASQSSVVAHWQPVADPARRYTYDFELLDQQGGRVGTLQSELITTAAAVPVFPTVVVCRGRVRTTVGDSFGLWSPEITLRIVVLPTPADLRLSFDGASSRLSVAWTQPAGLPDVTCDLKVTQASTTAVLAERTGLSVTQTTIDLPELAVQTGISYTVSVRFVTASAISDWSAATYMPIAEPNNIDLSFRAEPDPNSSALTIKWTGLETAAYEVQLLVNGAPMSLRTAVPHSSLSIPAAELGVPLNDGTLVKVKVRAVQRSISSAWSADTPAAQLNILILPILAEFRLTYADGTLTGHWQGEPHAHDYALSLSTGGAVVHSSSATQSPIVFHRSASVTILPGSSYLLTGRAHVERQLGLPANTEATVPTLETLAQHYHAEGHTAAQTASSLLLLQPGLVAGELLCVLATSGYPAVESTPAVHISLPGQDVHAMVGALKQAYPNIDVTSLRTALQTAGYSGEEIDGALRALLGPQLSDWVGAYTAEKNKYWGNDSAPMVLGTNGSFTIFDEPINFHFSPDHSTIIWDYQLIRGNSALGYITFHGNGKGRYFEGMIQPRQIDPRTPNHAVPIRGTLSGSPRFWSSALNSPANTGRSLLLGPAAPNVVWQARVGGNMRGGPAVDARGNIYVGAEDKHLYCVNSRGSIVWKYASNYPFYPTPAIGPDGTIYGASSALHAVAPNGTPKWKFARKDIGMVLLMPPKLSPDSRTVYINANSSTGIGDRLIAVDAASGAQKWERIFAKGSSSLCGVAPDGTVYVGSEEMIVYALNPANGAIKWKYQSGNGWIRGPIAVDDHGHVYVCVSTEIPNGNALVCLNPDGSVRWNYVGGGYLSNPPSIAISGDGTIFVGFYGMHALDPGGKLIWKTSTANSIGIYPGAAAVDEAGTIYFGTSDRKVFAYCASGQLLWSYDGGADCAGPAIVEDGGLVFSSGSSVILLR